MLPVDLNFRDPVMIADPYPIYTELQQMEPIYYRQKTGDWILTRYADVKLVLSDKRFEFPDLTAERSDALSAPSFRELNFLQLRRKCAQLRNLWIVNRGISDHARLKRILAGDFTRRGLATFRPKIEALTQTLLDQLQEKTTVDLVSDFAYPLSVLTACALLQIPSGKLLDKFDEWGHSILDGIEIDATTMLRERGLLASIGLTRHLAPLLNDQSLSFQHLIQGCQHGQLSHNELLANSTFLLLASIVTTQSVISKSLWVLMRHPDRLAQLRSAPHLLAPAIEECLRYAPPTHMTTRGASETVNLRGREIQRGQVVHLVLAAANRDPQQFPSPHQFDIARQPNAHLAFGYGRHHCLGASLARMQVQIAIGALIRRLPKLALISAEWRTGLRSHGLKTLKVQR